MGRDWSWLGGGRKKKSSKKDTKATPPPSSSPAGDTATAAGCMTAVFNIFDLQHLHFPINHHHLNLPKGVDAEETPSSPTRKDGNLNISMGVKIKTKPQATSSSSLSATESYSPSVKTPTLVARLMGLDLVPDNYTPSSSHSNKQRHYSLQRNSVDGGTRSTPRISLGRRSVDNINVTRVKEMKIHEDKENKSPRDYAKQIVMQFKESVTRRRRMGTDITNKEQESREIHEINNVVPKILETTVKVKSKTRLQTVEEEIEKTEQDKKQSNSATNLKKAENFKSRLVKPNTKPQSSLQTNSVAPKILETTVKVQEKNRLQTVQEELQGTEQDTKQSKKQSSSARKRKKAENFKSIIVMPPHTMQENLFVRSTATRDIDNKDSSKLRETQLSRNRASSEFNAFQSQSQIIKRTLVHEGIGNLVAGAFPETGTQSQLAFEGEGIVAELERGIFEALVAETTTDYYDTWNKTVPFKRGTWGVHVTRYLANVGSHHDASSLFRERRLRPPRG